LTESGLNNKKVTIIGAGPAGLSAAIQLAKYGVHSTIIDENQAIGGAIYRQPASQNGNAHKADEKFKSLKSNINRYRDFISFRFNSEVVGAFESAQELAVLENGLLSQLKIDQLIISTGCFERGQPFPGWTLPGVMAVGGAQLQIKSGLVKPGKSIVLVGTGPLLLLAAVQFHKAGVDVRGVFEAGRRRELLKEIPLLLSKLSLLAKGFEYLGYLKKAKIPVKFGWGIVEASGDEVVTHVKVAPFDKNWHPQLARSNTIETDCLAVEYGFVARSELTQLIGCNHQYSESSGGLIPIVDHWQRSSKKGVYIAGDSAGVFGAETAAEQGIISAIGCLIDLKLISETEAEKISKSSKKKIARLTDFRHAFDQFSELKTGLLELPNADTIICRCENVRLETVQSAIDEGVTDMVTLKMTTRIGMGDCQGRMCGSYCRDLLKNKTGRESEEIGFLKPRFPLSPIPFSAMTTKPEDK